MIQMEILIRQTSAMGATSMVAVSRLVVAHHIVQRSTLKQIVVRANSGIVIAAAVVKTASIQMAASMAGMGPPMYLIQIAPAC